MFIFPFLFLLDECTSNLGWLHAQTIERELLRMKARGVCIVMVTHNISQAHRIADSIVVLRDGRRLNDNDPFAVSMLTGSGWITNPRKRMIAVDGVRCNDRFPLVEQVVSEPLRGGGVGWLNDQVGVRVEHDVVPKFVPFQIDGVLKSRLYRDRTALRNLSHAPC